MVYSSFMNSVNINLTLGLNRNEQNSGAFPHACTVWIGEMDVDPSNCSGEHGAVQSQMGHRAKGANFNDKNQESFREEEGVLNWNVNRMVWEENTTFSTQPSKVLRVNLLYTRLCGYRAWFPWKKPLKTLVLDNHLMQWWHTVCLIHLDSVALAHRESQLRSDRPQHRPTRSEDTRQDLKRGHTDFQTERVQSVKSSEHLQDPQTVFSAGWLDSPKYKSWPCQCYVRDLGQATVRLSEPEFLQLDNEYSFTHHTVFL